MLQAVSFLPVLFHNIFLLNPHKESSHMLSFFLCHTPCSSLHPFFNNFLTSDYFLPYFLPHPPRAKKCDFCPFRLGRLSCWHCLPCIVLSFLSLIRKMTRHKGYGRRGNNRTRMRRNGKIKQRVKTILASLGRVTYNIN